MPPVLRPLKDDILKIRKELPPDDKRTSQVKYLPNWPYVCLTIKGKSTKHPRITKQTIIQNYLAT